MARTIFQRRSRHSTQSNANLVLNEESSNLISTSNDVYSSSNHMHGLHKNNLHYDDRESPVNHTARLSSRVISSRWNSHKAGLSDNEEDTVSPYASPIKAKATSGLFRYLMICRKHLYFGVSKPTHYDVENLSKIAAFGKTKFTCLLLLPLLFYLLLSAAGSNGSSHMYSPYHMFDVISNSPSKLLSIIPYYSSQSEEHISYVDEGHQQKMSSFLFSWWPFSYSQNTGATHEDTSNEGHISYIDDGHQQKMSSSLFSWWPFSYAQNTGATHEDTSNVYEEIHDSSNINIHHASNENDKASSGFSFSWWPTYSDEPSTFSNKNEAFDTTARSVHFTSSQSINKSEMKALIQEVLWEELHAAKVLENMDKTRHWTVDEIAKIRNQFSSFLSDFKSLSETVHTIQKNVERKQSQSDDLQKSSVEYQSLLAELSHKFHNVEGKVTSLDSLLNNFKNCCRNESELITTIERHLATLLQTVMTGNDDGKHPTLFAFREWLTKNFVDSNKFSAELKMAASKARGDETATRAAILDMVKKEMSTFKEEITVSSSSTTMHDFDGSALLSLADVEAVVKKAIFLYDADKTGQTDYALESGGGSIVNTRCSETYSDRSPRVTILGFPLWYGTNSPRNAIQPDMHPGQCWAFKGSQGYLVIQLANTIRPTEFVMEHISKSLSPPGNINSAPQEFSVWGLQSEKDNEGQLLGEYVYDKDGEPLQYFPVQAKDVGLFTYVELKIASNHGDLDYTCLYRFRVHGMRH